MGRQPCCNNDGVKKGPWRPEEDILLVSYVQEHGPGNWRAVPTKAGLGRCSKSCRLRWTNYLRPGIKRGNFTELEEEKIFHLQTLLGNKWAAIAFYLPQRTDNDIKNHWNTHLKKKLLKKMYNIQSGSREVESDVSSSHASSLPLHKAWEALEALPRQGTPPPETKPNPNPNCTYASSTGNIARLLQGWTNNSLIPAATTNLASATDVPARKQRSVNGAAPEAGEIEGGNGNVGDELSEACDEGRREHAPTRLVEDWLFDEMEGYGEAQGVEEGFIPLDFLMK